MIIRTISQLPEESTASDNDLFEVSKQHNSAYISKKIKYSSFKNNINNYVSGQVGNAFHLYSSGTIPLNVKTMNDRINALSSNNITFYGTKTFNSIPRIGTDSTAGTIEVEYKREDPACIPNVAEVKRLIKSRACFIDNTYTVDSNPGEDVDPPFAIDSDEFMHWHFDDNTRDSTEWMNPEKANQKTDKHGIMCRQSGWLTMYGWLADNGYVLPQDCWVGLYGKLNVYDDVKEDMLKDKWVLLQMQPWIRGQNATQLQYVCFGLPVNEGLYLKVKTGFLVNGHVGGFQDSRSLTYALNQPNSFVGYILHPENN